MGHGLLSIWDCWDCCHIDIEHYDDSYSGNKAPEAMFPHDMFCRIIPLRSRKQEPNRTKQQVERK